MATADGEGGELGLGRGSRGGFIWKRGGAGGGEATATCPSHVPVRTEVGGGVAGRWAESGWTWAVRKR